MTTKKLVSVKNLGKGFKLDKSGKKINLDLSEFIDKQSTHILNGKLFAGQEPIYVKDLFRLLAKTQEKTRILRTAGIHPIIMEMPVRSADGTTARGSTGFPKIAERKTSREQQLYQMGDRLKSFYNDTPSEELYASSVNGKKQFGEINQIVSADGFIVCGNGVDVYITVQVSYQSANRNSFDYEYISLKKHLNFSASYDIDNSYTSQEIIDEGILYSNGIILPNDTTFIESVPSDNMESWSKWSDWEVIDEIPKSVIAGANSYTASRGVKLVGNDIQANILNNSMSGLKMTTDGKMYAPGSATRWGVVTQTIVPKDIDIIDTGNYFPVFVIPQFVPPTHIATFNDTGTATVNGKVSLQSVKVTYRFTQGLEYIQDIQLADGAIDWYDTPAKTGSSKIAFFQDANIREYSWDKATGVLSFVVTTVPAYTSPRIQLVMKVDLTSFRQTDVKQLTVYAESDSSTPDTAGMLNIRVNQPIHLQLNKN